ncbi:MAG: polysaccharide deacetylase family protein [Solirubrobacterales bacterium]|nr:polysaccharide deacetylase family protein [Solirubrobacterales bacterium]
MPSAARALDIRRTLPRETEEVAITFDDGPHPEGTPAILELLAKEHVHATFFMVGEQVERRPALAAEVASEGHVIGLHCHRHRLQLRLSRAAIHDDLERGRAAITDATATDPQLHRAPYGIYSATGLTALRATRMAPLLWSRWGKDWRKFTTPQRIFNRVTRGLTPGDVILLHDADFYSAKGSHRNTAGALELILAELKQRELGTTIPPPG